MKRDWVSQSIKVARVFQRARDLLGRCGYQEMALPALEKDQTDLKEGLKTLVNGDLFRVHPDPTSQILSHVKGPDALKVFYCSEVLSFHGKSRWQIGVERMGEEKTGGTVELLNLLIRFLESLGIQDFFIDIGSIKLWESHIADIPEHREEIWRSIRQRNFGMIEELPISEKKKQELWKLLNTRSQSSDDEEMSELLFQIQDKRIYVDMGTIRFLPYYHELVFEIYVPSFGAPLGGGGRYRVNGGLGFGFALDAEILSQLQSSAPKKTEAETWD